MEIRNRQSFYQARLSDQESVFESDSSQATYQNLKLFLVNKDIRLFYFFKDCIFVHGM